MIWRCSRATGLEELVRWSNLPKIGIVGAQLVYPDGRIQHSGVVVGMGGVGAHIFHGKSEFDQSIFGSINWYRNYSAVTGAAQMMRREIYELVGGYDESYDVSYSDVAICHEVTKRGYRVLYNPFARLVHYESQTRDAAPSVHDMLLATQQLASVLEDGDPYFSPHLSYGDSFPRFRRSDEPTPLEMIATYTGMPLQAIRQRIQLGASARRPEQIRMHDERALVPAEVGPGRETGG